MTEAKLRRLVERRRRAEVHCEAARLALRGAIFEARAQGWTLRRIAAATGLSFGRIRQITSEDS